MPVMARLISELCRRRMEISKPPAIHGHGSFFIHGQTSSIAGVFVCYRCNTNVPWKRNRGLGRFKSSETGCGGRDGLYHFPFFHSNSSRMPWDKQTTPLTKTAQGILGNTFHLELFGVTMAFISPFLVLNAMTKGVRL